MRSALCALLWCLPLTKTRASTPPEGHRVTCHTTPRARFCRFSFPFTRVRDSLGTLLPFFVPGEFSGSCLCMVKEGDTLSGGVATLGRIRGRGPPDTSPEGAKETVGGTEWSEAERSHPGGCPPPSPMFAVSPWRRFPRQVVLVPLSSGASLISSWAPAPPERTECRNAWQVPAIFWNRLRTGRELAPLSSGASTVHSMNLRHFTRRNHSLYSLSQFSIIIGMKDNLFGHKTEIQSCWRYVQVLPAGDYFQLLCAHLNRKRYSGKAREY